MELLPRFWKLQRSVFWVILTAIAIHLLWYHGSKSLMDLAALFSLIVIVANGKKSYLSLNSYQIIWCMVLVCLSVSYLLSFSVHGSDLDERLFWESARTVLISTSVFLVLNGRIEEIKEKIIIALTFCTFLGGGLGFFDWMSQGFSGRTSAGAQIINLYAAVLAATTSIVSIHFFDLRSGYLKNFVLFSVCFGLLGVVASGSRAGLLVLLVLLFAISVIKTHGRIRIYTVTVVTLLTLSVLSLSAVKDRIDDAYVDFSQYFQEGSTLVERSTSLGLRFEMWMASVDYINEKPLLGYGNRPLDIIFERRIENLESPKSFKDYHHVHNDLLQAELSRGLFGLLVYLLLVFYPIWMAVKLKLVTRQWIVALAVTYLLAGLSDVMLSNAVSLVFYLVVMSLLLAGGKKQIKS